jgi:hypothetical protein
MGPRKIAQDLRCLSDSTEARVAAQAKMLNWHERTRKTRRDLLRKIEMAAATNKMGVN